MPKSLTVFVPHCSGMLTDHLPYGDGLVAHGFITHLARRGHRLHVAAQEVALREPLHPNVTVYEIPLKATGGISGRVEYMRRVRRLLQTLSKNIRFDLMHQMNPVFTGMSLALSGSGLPVVLGTYVARWPDDPHSLAARGWVGSMFRYGRDAICAFQQRHADALVLTCPAARNRIPRPDGVQDRMHFLPHGIDPEMFSPDAAFEADTAHEKRPAILFFANVTRRKGIFTLLEAFSKVAQEFPAARLQIAGDGPELPEVKRLVAARAYADSVEFLGRQERADAPALYRNCAVFCLPSFGEPYGTTLVEAMSCGKAVVATDAGGPVHIVSKDGGIHVPPGDAAALAGALVELLRDPERCLVMGRHNRRSVVATMSWDKVAEQLEGIYVETLARTTKGKVHDHKQITQSATNNPRVPAPLSREGSTDLRSAS